VLVLAGIGVGAAGTITLISAKRLPGKIEYYAPIKPAGTPQPPREG
jgi:hypothetical protein